MLDQLNGAIATASLDRVLPGLVGRGEVSYTVATFWERFRDEYCKPRMSSWRRYQQSFAAINADLGSIPLREFRRHHLHEYLERRIKTVSRNTANRDIAAIKKMFSYALEVGAVEYHPLIKFPTFKVEEKALRLPTLDEFRALVESIYDPALRALVALLGETGMRRGEALNLTWQDIDFRGRRVVAQKTKGKKVRTIPLSDFAIEKLRAVTRFVGQPYVFCHQGGGRAGTRIRSIYGPLHRAAKEIGLEWITPHTLRHFRATAWLQHGVDIRTVKEALGHAAIATTSRYLKLVESHADRVLREAQEREQKEAEMRSKRDENGTMEK